MFFFFFELTTKFIVFMCYTQTSIFATREKWEKKFRRSKERKNERMSEGGEKLKQKFGRGFLIAAFKTVLSVCIYFI